MGKTALGSGAAAFGLLAALTACGPKSDGAGAEASLPSATAGAPAAEASPPTGEAVRAPRGGSVFAGGRAAAPAPTDFSGWVLSPPFYAAGVEPYWRLDVDASWFVFQRSGLAEIDAPIAAPVKERGADVFDVRPLKVVVQPGGCEIEGRFGEAVVSVTFEEDEFIGCGFAGGDAAAGTSAGSVDWTSEVAGAVPVIDACLARLGEAAVITSVYPREGDLTAVMLRTRSGRMHECGADVLTGEVAFLDAMEPGAGVAAGPRRFFRIENAGAPEACPDAEAVFDGDTLIGYLVSSSCKF